MAEISLHRPFPADAVAQWDYETDVAVIGFGAAGACASIEAADAGAKVFSDRVMETTLSAFRFG